MTRKDHAGKDDAELREKAAHREPGAVQEPDRDENENEPRTTSSGWFTTPKFGGATSGGGEIEPGPERD